MIHERPLLDGPPRSLPSGQRVACPRGTKQSRSPRGRFLASSGKLQVVHPPDLITADPEILGGTPVFRGTRVPVKTLFDYLESNYSLDEFIECFPSVPRELACRVLERSEAALLTAP